VLMRLEFFQDRYFAFSVVCIARFQYGSFVPNL
jgi:hypothetical protein